VVLLKNEGGEITEKCVEMVTTKRIRKGFPHFEKS
jgi:hypothetical protein